MIVLLRFCSLLLDVLWIFEINIFRILCMWVMIFLMEKIFLIFWFCMKLMGWLSDSGFCFCKVCVCLYDVIILEVSLLIVKFNFFFRRFVFFFVYFILMLWGDGYKGGGGGGVGILCLFFCFMIGDFLLFLFDEFFKVLFFLFLIFFVIVSFFVILLVELVLLFWCFIL